MSLDVYLKAAQPFKRPASSGIFVRENGQTKEITREEWDARNPGREPVAFVNPEEETDVLYHANITGNLGRMASEVDLYDTMWQPERCGAKFARDLIPSLASGLENLKRQPEHFKQFNPENGWGDYDGLVRFIEEYLFACISHPDATVEVSR